MIDIKAIKAAAEAATPQPWIDPGEGNMPFICMMTPDVVSAMCDEIESLREQIGAYQLHEKQLLAAKMGLECKVDRLRADAALGAWYESLPGFKDSNYYGVKMADAAMKEKP